MTQEFVIGVGREAMVAIFWLSAPPLIAALVVGLLVSILQAVTQIQEMTLAIIPKMIAVLVALLITFPWLLDVLSEHAIKIFRTIPIVAQ